HWIKLEMIRHIQESCPVVIPQSIHDGLIKIQKAIRESDEEMSREDIKEKLDFDENKMKKLESAKVQTMSLQSKQKSGDETSLLEDLISDDSLSPSEVFEKEDLIQFLNEILSELDERTYDIVMYRHLEEKARLQDLADKYGVSPERIRQIRDEETLKLRDRLLEKKSFKV
ncbi:MAG TPA: sigma factor-like helix-turn-helix DNA-binding protein, partial [Patescibacteria group bacterium]|nr:sigma factor-like helix-turn-helix DNA-binding protein [Patescibacteria group bacterium]